MENTRDLSQFGYREKEEAAQLLNEYIKNPEVLGDGVGIEFNPQSGYVFLIDEDYNAAMLNDNKLERWCVCADCGKEGFESEVNFENSLMCFECARKEN